MPALDQLGRPQRSLRLSVTDRCNLRCTYCMPEADYTWLPKHDILTFDETVRIVARFMAAGVDKVRVTGGEPLIRQDLPVLVRMLAGLGLRDLALTTNGIQLPEQGRALRDAGIRRVTVSLDTLRADRFRALAGRDRLDAVLAGIEHARTLAFAQIKLNTVVIRGQNDDELVELCRFARDVGAELRFIEYMDVGGATQWDRTSVVPRQEILARLADAFGGVEPLAEQDWAPADRFRLGDGLVVGVISSTTEPFCRTCDRTRLTADGMWYTCLYARDGIDLRSALRAGADDRELLDLIERVWSGRRDRAAEERVALREDRRALAGAAELRTNPHLEMHKRGG
ncbi:MAG: GTP 3',8-cyclase MoaA [Planctomycetota bacterium]|jgi:cyclic pyranopterin phosphate synthase